MDNNVFINHPNEQQVMFTLTKEEKLLYIHFLGADVKMRISCIEQGIPNTNRPKIVLLVFYFHQHKIYILAYSLQKFYIYIHYIEIHIFFNVFLTN